MQKMPHDILSTGIDSASLPHSTIEYGPNGRKNKITVYLGDIAAGEEITGFYTTAFLAKNTDSKIGAATGDVECIESGRSLTTLGTLTVGLLRSQGEERPNSVDVHVEAGTIEGTLTVFDRM